ncbi:unnamed protein product [Acanthoscelides obtectus]|uniref:Uncharacterized protein n=1 Tax=Acanthoscelides obtectus TaxID=200917 RepID=A0A9P0MBY0_ACAOB|nr:unnamed protein product [Acanthoscelides obtectus]CAK1625068.1 hypothetical protein AOBTE_LOCUS2928 [Acanthoscelides obtectus]
MNSEIRKTKKTKSGDGTDDRLWKKEDFLEESQLQSIEKPTTSNTTTHRSKKLKTKAKEKTDEEGDAMLEKAKNILNTPTDEYTVFGEYVASELRQLRSDERKRRLKRIIQKAIVAMSEEDEVEFYGSRTLTPLMSPTYSHSSTYPSTSNTVESFEEAPITNTTTNLPPIRQFYENYLPGDNPFSAK